VTWPFGDDHELPVRELLRPIEVPVLTEVKRRLAHDQVAAALEYAYPQVLTDLQRAYGVEFPPGFSHEDIVDRGFSEPMQPFRVFIDRLYRLYAPVRYGHRAPPGTGEEVLELVQSLYSPEPMWRLYVIDGNGGSAPARTDLLPGDARGVDAP
jgi:hypothetical protein